MIILFFFLISIYYEFIIEDAVYNLIYNNLYFNYENLTLQLSKSLKEEINANFRITERTRHLKKTFYFIQHINTNLYLLSSKNNSKNLLLGLINEDKDLASWNIIKTKNNKYKIQNKNLCYITITKYNISCEDTLLENNIEFNLIKIYEEVKEDDINQKIIEKEPIDVLIKYIDLRDPYLNRKNIRQIKKDFDNEELRYSIRSIIANIPWIRKIFILMPNKKVRFFKDYNLIKHKIIYIQDKDILGYDSSNSLAFQYRCWKMEKFGISKNFIIMDDDYFIGQPLNKTNFFYVNKGKVTPIIITSKFTKLSKNMAKNKLKEYKKIINKSRKEQTSPIFRYSLYLTYSFILQLFNDYLYIPVHTHNAIPVNLEELKEIYNIINNSKYKECTLNSLYRHIENIQFQTFVNSYIFFKYKKKVRNISNKIINNKDSLIYDYKFSLFCINTGSIDYAPSSFLKTKILLEYRLLIM